MLLLLVDFFKLLLLSGLILAVWNLAVTRLLMPKIFWLIALFVQLAFLLMLHGIEFIAFVILLLYVGAISVLFLFVVMILNPDAKDATVRSPTAGKPMPGRFQPPSWLKAYYPLTPLFLVFLFRLLITDAYLLEQGALTAFGWSIIRPLLFGWQIAFPVKFPLEIERELLDEVPDVLEAWKNPNPPATSMEPAYPALAGEGTVHVAGVSPNADLWLIAESFYRQEFLQFWLVGLILLVAMIGAIVLTLQKTRGLKRQKGTNQTKRYTTYNR
mgnify:CR=1 FL=1